MSVIYGTNATLIFGKGNREIITHDPKFGAWLLNASQAGSDVAYEGARYQVVAHDIKIDYDGRCTVTATLVYAQPDSGRNWLEAP